MRTIGLLSILSLLTASAVAQEQPQPVNFQNIGTMSQLMVDIIYPMSDDIFYIGREPPQTDAEWARYQKSALTLAESGNLLMMPGRARDQDKWMKDAKLLVEVGKAAYQATKAKDIDAVLKLNDQLYAACVTCHQDYRQNYGRRRLPN